MTTVERAVLMKAFKKFLRREEGRRCRPTWEETTSYLGLKRARGRGLIGNALYVEGHEETYRRWRQGLPGG